MKGLAGEAEIDGTPHVDNIFRAMCLPMMELGCALETLTSLD